MPNLSAEEYKELSDLVAASNRGEIKVSPEEYERAQAAIASKEDQAAQGWADAGTPEQNAAAAAKAQEPPDLSPEALKRAADTGGVREQVDKARAAPVVPDLTQRLDPTFSLIPQALAIQPATTHPQGDKAAEADWLVSGGNDATGTVFVYEPPLAAVRKRMLEDPAFSRALFEHIPPKPEEIMGMDNSSPIYKAAADKMWRDSAEAAAGAGKTAYRYSKAPWLQGGAAMSGIKTLGMKTLGTAAPASEGFESFIMGMDDTAAFGAGRAALETALPEAQGENAQTVEENPGFHLAGQALGALSGWGAANKLYSFVTSGGRKAATALGGGLAARTATSGASAALAGGAVQAGQEGVDAAASLAQTGEAGTTLGEAAGRIGDTAMLSGGLGVGGEILGTAAKKGADWVRHGPRYQGAPGRAEAAGIEPKFGSGVKAPKEVDDAIAKGRKLDVPPQDVMAKELAPGIERGASEAVKKVIHETGEETQKFYGTPEGNQKLPLTNAATAAIDVFRSKMTEGGKGRLIGEATAIKSLFNGEIVGSVSLKPGKGSVPISADEADLFLSMSNKKKLFGSLPKATGAAAGAGGDDLGAALKRRGINEIHIVPNHMNAREHDAFSDFLQEKVKHVAGQKKPGERELGVLQKAAFQDRDARPYQGQPGGWSALKQSQSERIGKVKDIEKRAAPGGSAFETLASRSTQRSGEMLDIEALQAAADKGGVREKLNNLRALDPLQQLRDQMSYGRTGQGNRVSPISPTALFDAATLRFGFPGARAIEGAKGPVRGGMGGRLGTVGQDEKPKEEQRK